jgi:hypothetical protein
MPADASSTSSSPVAPLPLPVAEVLGEQRGQRAGERVDLVGREDCAVDELRLVLREEALEPQQQRVVPAPLDRRILRARVELGERGVERTAAGGAGRKRGRGILDVEDEGFAGESSGPL